MSSARCLRPLDNRFDDRPLGVDLTDSQTPSNDAPATSVFTLAVIAVALRFVARGKAQKAKISTDDYTIVFGFVRSSMV